MDDISNIHSEQRQNESSLSLSLSSLTVAVTLSPIISTTSTQISGISDNVPTSAPLSNSKNGSGAHATPTSTSTSSAKLITVAKMDEIIDCKKRIGKGSSSNVALYQHVHSGIHVALKIIDRVAASRNSARAAAIMREKAILQMCHHPNIVKLYGTLKDETSLYFVMSLAGNIQLATIIHSVAINPLPLYIIRNYAKQLAGAIDYLHSLGIVHRDIKPKNIMVDTTNGANHQICLVDFGSVAQLKASEKAHTLCGTYHYYAPEMLTSTGGYSYEVDWWAFGCVLFELLTGNAPFYDDDRLKCYEMIVNDPVVFPRIRQISTKHSTSSISVAPSSATTTAAAAAAAAVVGGITSFESKSSPCSTLTSKSGSDRSESSSGSDHSDHSEHSSGHSGSDDSDVGRRNEMSELKDLIRMCLHKQLDKRAAHVNTILAHPFFS